jgi:hypothetical protein
MRNEIVGRINDDLAEGSSTLRFDYSSVSLSVAKFLKGQADRIRRQCATSTIQIGRGLLEAKRHVSHGAFLRWVEAEVCMSVRTAQAYMRVASWAADKGIAAVSFSPSALYLLAASNTPDGFVTSVLRRAEAGEYIAPAVMRKELRALKKSEREDCSNTRTSTLGIVKREAVRLAVTQESQSDGKLAELVSILLEGLSPTDFTRVRNIMTSEAVITDPQLAQNLGRAFCSRKGSAGRRRER